MPAHRLLDCACPLVAVLLSSPVWAQCEIKHLTAADASAQDEFGAGVAVDGEWAVVGAPGDNADTGAAYVIRRTGSDWAEDQKLTAGSAAPSQVPCSRVPRLGPGRPGGDEHVSGFYLMARPAEDNRGRKPSAYKKGRECESTGCGQELTRYNPGPFCYVHTPKSHTRFRT